MLTSFSAGVLGLSTALAIQQHLKPGQSLLIVAREFPNTTSINYASPWAGAHYRPAPGKSPQVMREARWCRHSYEVFRKIAAEEPAAGVEFMEGIEHFEDPPQEYLDAVRDPDSAYAHLGDSLRELTPAELPESVKWGIRYRAYCINPPVYLAHLLRKFILRGGQTKEYTLASLLEAFHLANNVTTVVNCSGLGFADPKSYIIRGMQLTSHPFQTILPLTTTIYRPNLSRPQPLSLDRHPPKRRRLVVLLDPAAARRRHHHRRHQAATRLEPGTAARDPGDAARKRRQMVPVHAGEQGPVRRDPRHCRATTGARRRRPVGGRDSQRGG